MKKIKVDEEFLISLQNTIMVNSNSPLISIEIQRACEKFIKELEDIPLSEELQ